ncbi:hypothetical protein PAEH1_01285 [Paenalcaligenes hominis]|uniref:Uncharacterized protein n=1 Tax=Paenalcaligenes hominis TaxID=643674 RepID=A0A1U9JXP1_9BURK|nr:hypothetical protein [Paenalcaligenes hominis]AQS50516.1 hypothetical protein PAEH1_01285 [Paenalcaligenes hominis]
MSKFKSVLGEEVCGAIGLFLSQKFGFDNVTPEMVKLFSMGIDYGQEAVLAKLHEQQEPEWWAIHMKDRTFATNNKDEAKAYAEVKEKWAPLVTPLYTHPMPALEQEPIGYLHANEISFLSAKGITAEQAQADDYNIPLYTHPAPNPKVFSLTIPEAEAYIKQLESENDAKYVAFGADAYYHSCKELELWQQERLNKGLDEGPQGTLMGWMNWAQEFMDSFHVPASVTRLQSEVEQMTLMLENKEWADHTGQSELGSRLEFAISALLNELHEAKELTFESSNIAKLSLSIDTKEVQALLQSYIDSLKDWQLVPKHPDRDTLRKMFYEIFGMDGIEEEYLAARYRNMLASFPKYSAGKS